MNKKNKFLLAVVMGSCGVLVAWFLGSDTMAAVHQAPNEAIYYFLSLIIFLAFSGFVSGFISSDNVLIGFAAGLLSGIFGSIFYLIYYIVSTSEEISITNTITGLEFILMASIVTVLFGVVGSATHIVKQLLFPSKK